MNDAAPKAPATRSWRIVSFVHGVVNLTEAEYLRMLWQSLHDLIGLVEAKGLAANTAVVHAKLLRASPFMDLLAWQRALCALIHLAKDNDLNDNLDVNQAKELIRCRVLQCGLAGACNGVGTNAYPCPLREPRA